jgi:hypothetical protein
MGITDGAAKPIGRIRFVRSRRTAFGLFAFVITCVSVPAFSSENDDRPIKDPAVDCDRLVLENLPALAEKYEVSVPTSDLKCALDETDKRLGSIIHELS